MPEPPKTPNTGPIYRQIEESLRARIVQGDWAVGAMLPGRRELAREYGVSLVTMERAVSLLHAAGIVRTDNRRGTFVTSIEPAFPAAEPVSVEPTVSQVQVAQPIVGIIAPLYLDRCDHLQLNNYLVLSLLTAMESACAEDGMQVRFFNRMNSPAEPLLSLSQSLQLAEREKVDAIVLIALGDDSAYIDESLSSIASGDIPVVCITSCELLRPVPHVFYDNHSAGYQAAQHLIDAHHRDILVLAPFNASWVRERIAGVRTAVEHARLPESAVRVCLDTDHAWIVEEDPEPLGYESAILAFAEGNVPSSVICINDGAAFGFLRAAADYQRRVGVDVAVVGFDNHPRSIPLGITTLRAPMEAMGQEAIRLLKREMQGDGSDYQVRLRWRLIPRASSRMIVD